MAEQSQTVDLPKRFPLIIEPGNRGESTRYDSRLVNAYMETNEKEKNTYIYERPGLDEQSRPPAGDANGYGVFNWLGDLYAIFGGFFYKNGVSVSAILDSGQVWRFDSVLGSVPKLVMVNGIRAYYYSVSTGLVQIVDVDFTTPQRKGWAYLNGTLYSGRITTQILGSEINDPVNWSPLNVLQAQIEPDQGVFLAKQLVYVVFLKTWSGEIFYDAGNPTGSPLARVEGAKANKGCLAQDSVQDLGSVLIWVGSSQNGAPEVLMLENLKLDTISTKPIERLLAQADFTTVYSLNVKIEGHRFYILTIKNSNLTLAYDLDERMWSQWTDESGNYLPWVSSTLLNAITPVIQHETNGRIYYISSDYATDDGVLIPVSIYTPSTDLGTKRGKYMGGLFVVSDQKANAEMQVRNNDADYAPAAWSDFRTVDLSQDKPWLPDEGTFVNRAYHLYYKSRTRMPRIQALDMQIDLCTL